MTQDLKRILYVDDEPHIQEVARMCLEMNGGFDVTCLNSGVELLEKFPSIGCDVILLDVMMPQLDGPSTLKALQERYDLRTPVIFMTARVQPAEIAEYMRTGAVGVIPKPFDPMTIARQVKEIWQILHEPNDL